MALITKQVSFWHAQQTVETKHSGYISLFVTQRACLFHMLHRLPVEHVNADHVERLNSPLQIKDTKALQPFAN